MKRKPLLRHTLAHTAARARVGAEDGELQPLLSMPPSHPELYDPDKGIDIRGDPCSMLYVAFWIMVAAAVLGLGIGGFIISTTQIHRNNLQTLQLYAMRENVTYLDFLNLFDISGISLLVQLFYPNIPNNITALNTSVTHWEGQVLVLQNLFQIIQADILNIFYQIQGFFIHQSLMYNESVLLNQTLNNISNTVLPSFYANIIDYNDSFLYTVNGVGNIPPNQNVNISGVGGLEIYPALTENATLVLDGCYLQSQINAIDANFTAAVEQFIKDTVGSNITVDTINGQFPIDGNINLIAGDAYTNITTTFPNEVLVSLKGIQSLSGVFPNLTADGANIRIHATGSPWITVNQTGPKQITIGASATANFVRRIDGGFNINSTNTSATEVTLTNTLTQAEYVNDDVTRVSCEAVRYFSPPDGIIFGTGDTWEMTPSPYSPPNSNLNAPYISSAMIRPCRYNTLPGGNPVYNLNDANATFLITFTLMSNDTWSSATSRNENGYRIELLWCIVPNPSLLCTKNVAGYSTALIETIGIVNPCFFNVFGPNNNNPGGTEYCWVTFAATVMYTTPSTVGDRYLKFSAYNGAFNPYILGVWGYESRTEVVRVL